MISFEDFILENDGPIYLQIIRYLKQGTAAGTIGDQEEVPSRRMLSALLGVNPNTIQKAYRLLEEEGILLSRSGAKSNICADPEKRKQIRQELLQNDTRSWVDAMKSLKLSEKEALDLARHIWEENICASNRPGTEDHTAGAPARQYERSNDSKGRCVE